MIWLNYLVKWQFHDSIWKHNPFIYCASNINIKDQAKVSVSRGYLSRRFSKKKSFRISWHQSQSFHLSNWTLTYSECRGLMLHCDTSINFVLIRRKKLLLFAECYFCLHFLTVIWWFHQVSVAWCRIGYVARVQRCPLHIWTHPYSISALH